MRRVLIVLGVLAVVLAVVTASGYWYVRERQRIEAPELQTRVERDEGVRSVTCVEEAKLGRRWHCAGVKGDESECFAVSVSWRNEVTIRSVGPTPCREQAGLAGAFG